MRVSRCRAASLPGVGVMFYWLVSNFWTMVQQFLVIRNMPTPGSEAALQRETRMAKRAQRRGFSIIEDQPLAVDDVKISTQRVQPVNKNRSKKTGNKK